MSYKYILFDADDTLLDYANAEKYALYDTLKELDFNCIEEVSKNFNTICDSLWHEFKLDQPLDKNVQVNYHSLYYKYSIERFRVLLTLLTINTSAEALNEKYLQSLSQCNLLVEDALEVCKELSRRYKIFIITNGIAYIQKSRIEGSKIKSLISDIIVSENAGCIKPGKQFFDYLLEKIGKANLSEMLLVGDSLMTDIFGGNEYGIDTCWFNNKVKVNKYKIYPKYEITKLTDLLTFI